MVGQLLDKAYQIFWRSWCTKISILSASLKVQDHAYKVAISVFDFNNMKSGSTCVTDRQVKVY